MTQDTYVQTGLIHEFVTCGCKRGEVYASKTCCVAPSKDLVVIGKRWASPLSGFVAGVIATSVVLVPWMFFLGALVRWPHVV